MDADGALFDDTGTNEVIGNGEAVSKLGKFAFDIDHGVKRKPVMLSGPSGTGKSLAAHLTAKEHGWHVVELNASDYRDQESLDRMLLAASQSRTIFGKKNLILLDEIDELTGLFDKGASSAITNIINSTKNPIIFTANDFWDKKISFLRNYVDNIEFKKLPPADVLRILEKTAKRTGVNVGRETMDMIANRSGGDARSAINDMEVMNGAPEESVDAIGLRDRKVDIFATLDKIFFSNTYGAPIAASANSDVETEMLMRWIDENLPKRYTDGKDLATAYGMLSGATMFYTRAARAQYYTYWRYMNVMMSSGIALAKDHYPDKSKRYGFPKMISELSRTKEARGVGSTISKKLRKKIHVSAARIKSGEMGIIAEMVKRTLKEGSDEEKEQMYDFFYSKLGLEQKEVKWLAENS